MDTVSAAQFVRDQIPPTLQSLIPTTLRTAYNQAALIVKSDPVFQIESAVDNRGRLIAWAVDFGFKRLIDSGQWPYDYRWRHFAKPTGRYLEVRLPHSLLTISQVSDPKRQPRNAVYRQQKRLNNEPFFDLDEFREDNSINGLPQFIVIHGHQDLNFVHIGVPHCLHDRDWIYRTPNLLNLPHVMQSGLPEAEETDYEALITLRDEIQKWRRENGE